MHVDSKGTKIEMREIVTCRERRRRAETGSSLFSWNRSGKVRRADGCGKWQQRE